MGYKRSTRRKKHLNKKKKYSMKTRKNRLGGSSDISLAYTGSSVPTQPNPFLSYMGKGGTSCGLSEPVNIQPNTNSANPTLPNTGAPILPTGTPIWNQASAQQGGTCEACSLGTSFMIGGVRHRSKCRCSKCKSKYSRKIKKMKGGNASYPNGLVGTPFIPGNTQSWPGVDGIPGNSNYFSPNMYVQDPQTSMKDLGNPPFSGGRKKKQRGGTLSNFLGQDLINLGRQFQFGIGSAYNALAGYSAPVNPLPWRDQMPNRIPLNTSAL